MVDSIEHKRQALLWLDEAKRRIEATPGEAFDARLRDAESTARQLALCFPTVAGGPW